MNCIKEKRVENVQNNQCMRSVIIGVIAILLDTVLFMGVLLSTDAMNQLRKIGNGNLLLYLITSVLFVLIFIIGIIFFSKFITVKFCENRLVKSIFLLSIILGSIAILSSVYVNEVNMFGGDSKTYIWHKISNYILVPTIIVLIIVSLQFIRTTEEIQNGKTIYLIYFVISLISGYSLYIPNYFNADLYHGHAYCNSIYQIMNNATYNEFFTSIYGHYAIFYRVPLGIIGCNMRNIVLIIFIIGIMAMLLSCLIVHNLIKKNAVRILACLALALPTVGMRVGNYWQVQPHRVIFPAILIYISCVFIKNKMTSNKILLGYFVSAIAIIWNTETGLVCAIAWAGLLIFDSICENKGKITCILKTIIKQVISVIISFFCAYCLVNLYNISCGGEINSLQIFLYPIFTLTDFITSELPKTLSAYMIELVLYAIIIGWILQKYVFSSIKYCEEERYDARLSVVITIIGMGQMTYFMNRAAYYNLDISHTSAILLSVILIKRGIMFIRKLDISLIQELHCYEVVKGSVAGVAFSVLVVLAAGTIIGGAVRLNTKLDNGYQNYNMLVEFANSIKDEVPKDTYAFGLGIPELYSVLEWNTQCYVIDFSDMNAWTEEFILNQAKSKNAIFITKDVYEKFELNDFKVKSVFEYKGSQFFYCIK